MQLARFPRRRYTRGATPLEPLPRLSRHLGGPEIWVKRDDLTGLAAGGNKTRKLEFLVADALAQSCDTLVTTGAVQSNHCRLTLAAAVREGLSCRLVLERRVPESPGAAPGGNYFLMQLLGADSITLVEATVDLDAEMRRAGAELLAAGRKAYIIPAGGSTPLGMLGYVACAQELLAQTLEIGLPLHHIVCASGSGGTHAGLLAGLLGSHADIALTGINVRRPRSEQESLVYGLAQELAAFLSLPPVPRNAVRALDDWLGPGYALASEAVIEAVRLAARLEGLLLDPVYTGKAMAGLIGLIRRGELARGENVLFLHTGGAAVLDAYRTQLLA